MSNSEDNNTKPIEGANKEYILEQEKFFESLCKIQFDMGLGERTFELGDAYIEKFQEIKDICDKYGFRWAVVNDDDDEFCGANNPLPLTNDIMLLTLRAEQDTRLLELAKLAKFLNDCNDAGIRLAGTSKKGAELKYSFTDKLLLKMLTDFVHSAIDMERNGFLKHDAERSEYECEGYWNEDWVQDVNSPDYEYSRYWKHKKRLIKGESFFVERYTDEEISQIIKYESLKLDQTNRFTPISKQGEIAKMILDKLERAGISLTNGERGWQTKVYSFVYDVMYILEYFNEDEGEFKAKKRNDKQHLIRQWLTAFERDSKKP